MQLSSGVTSAQTLMPDASTLVSMLRGLDREGAAQFIGEVRERGWLLVLTGHQFVEMLRHGSDEEVLRRFRFLNWLSAQPGVAWLSAGPKWESLGMIPHVTACEVKGVAAGIARAELRNYVLAQLFRLTPPPAAEYADLTALRPMFREQMEREREIASIVRADGLDFGGETIGELRRRRTYPTDVARRRILAQAADLAEQVHATGDKRIKNPKVVAINFLSSAADDLPEDVRAGETPADALIRSFGLDPKTISNEMSSDEFAHLAEFQQKIQLAGRQLGLDPMVLSAISLELIPTCLIQYLLRLARVKSGARASGGDLTDSYLASMAAYIDLVVADKRTVELMKQVRRDPRVGKIGAVCRVNRIDDLLALLAAHYE
jgi:hypothetical protein